ncbi:MAG: hypothetical protein KJ607_02490 [Bacteroidetes bacterium]|nr:hypothetical protein [Bacteroidota bacterium]
MRTRKIITWTLFLTIICGFILTIAAPPVFDWLNSVLIIHLGLYGLTVTATLLIHYYSESRQFKKVAKISWFVLLFISISLIILIPVLEILPSSFDVPSQLTLTFFFIVSIIMIVLYKKVDIAIFLLLIVSLLGLVFKHYHISGAGVLMIIGWALPAVLFLFIFYQRITEYDTRTNRYMNFFKNFICVTLTINYLGAIFKIQHWPGGTALTYAGLPCAVITILVIAFLLPNSNFIEWTKEHKRLFYRAFLIPLIYLSILTSLGFVFPDTMQSLMNRYSTIKGDTFYMNRYEIPEKDGM